MAELVVHAGGEVAPYSPVIGLWRDGGAPLAGVLSHAAAPRLRLVRTPRIVLCPGAYSQPPVFENNDLPGVFSARGVAAALGDDGLVPGACAVLSGDGPETQATAKLLAWAGMRVELTGGDVTRVDGGRRVATVSVEGGLRVSCDTVIVTSRPVPATELARLLGASLALDAASGAWAVLADGHGATGVPGLWAAGECVAALSASDAAEAGRRAGESALRA
jgi:sarcosine oxidase subunit alpha